MGRPRRLPLPSEADETRARFEAWRRTRRNGEHIPEDLWCEASGLARRLGINRVSLALGLSHTSLKEHVEKGQVRAAMPAVQPAFLELDGGRCQGDFPFGPVLEVTHAEGERLVMRWPAGSAIDACGLVATFLATCRSQQQGRRTCGRG